MLTRTTSQIDQTEPRDPPWNRPPRMVATLAFWSPEGNSECKNTMFSELQDQRGQPGAGGIKMGDTPKRNCRFCSGSQRFEVHSDQTTRRSSQLIAKSQHGLASLRLVKHATVPRGMAVPEEESTPQERPRSSNSAETAGLFVKNEPQEGHENLKSPHAKCGLDIVI